MFRVAISGMSIGACHRTWTLISRSLSCSPLMLSPAVETLVRPGPTSAVDQRCKLPTFDDPQQAFGSKTTLELLRAYLVFNICCVPFFVDHQAGLIKFTRRLMGKRLFKMLMKRTLYGQFLAGEDREEVLGLAARQRKYHLLPMFAFTAKEIHGVKGETGPRYDDPLYQMNFKAVMDEIDMASCSASKPGECVKISGKLTFFVAPDVLESANSVIGFQTQLLHDCIRDITTTPVRDCVRDVMSDLENYSQQHGLVVPSVPYCEENLDSYTTNMATHLALLDNEHLKRHLAEYSPSGCPEMTSPQRNELAKLWDWLTQLGQRAQASDVCLVVDAEQSYLQLTLDTMTLDLMRLFNRQRPVIHQTYQNYRQRTYDLVQRDFRMADTEDFAIGLKPVRGAYLEEERRLATEKGYTDPINPTYEATTDMYHRVARLILERARQHPSRTQVTFATHNLDTVKTIIGFMREMDMDSDNYNIAFAQLLGMRDHISFPLASAGYQASKLLHYGPVDQAMAYLSRRLQENRSTMDTANSERQLLAKELRRRMRFR